MSTALVCFRRDLRLHDNPALQQAVQQHSRVIPVYIHDPAADAPWPAGAASNWWLHHSLARLAGELAKRGSRLLLRQGATLTVLETLLTETGADHLYWNRCYEPARLSQDRDLQARLQQRGVTVSDHNASLLFEPWQVLKDNGEDYRVFTPFWRACLRLGLERPLLDAPQSLPTAPKLPSLTLDALQLLPDHPWADTFTDYWQPGEAGARAALDRFIEQGLADYARQRDWPAELATSRLSPHLHFGEISPARLVDELMQHQAVAGGWANLESWLRELGWREFAHYLLYHFPHTSAQPFDSRFASFTWEDDPKALAAWQRGQTGIPIVDAGMRELWQSGWMHNRVRMIVASLLTKNLLLPWQAGARWFWDTLVDADLAANTLGWQWTAGCGADAAPWFRIFNPVLQGQKFDPHGHYVRRWVPELDALPDRYLHQPWQLTDTQLGEYGIVMGDHYPRPIIDLAWSRQRALQRFDEIKVLKKI